MNDVRKMNPVTDVDDLITALNDGSPEVRRSAAEALGETEDVKAVDPLIQALQDEDQDVRQNAALALGMIGDTRAMAPLIQASKDEQDEYVRRAIQMGLDMIKKKAMDKMMKVY